MQASQHHSCPFQTLLTVIFGLVKWIGSYRWCFITGTQTPCEPLGRIIAISPANKVARNTRSHSCAHGIKTIFFTQRVRTYCTDASLVELFQQLRQYIYIVSAFETDVQSDKEWEEVEDRLTARLVV